MPYINPSRRPSLWSTMSPVNAGELNYCLTRLLQRFLGKTPEYQRYNAALGALEACKLELYRRKVAPYEDVKRQENGDV